MKVIVLLIWKKFFTNVSLGKEEPSTRLQKPSAVHVQGCKIRKDQLAPLFSLVQQVLVKRKLLVHWQKRCLLMKMPCYVLTCRNIWRNTQLLDLLDLLQDMLVMKKEGNLLKVSAENHILSYY